MIKITIVVLTLNEEKHIEGFIDNLKSLNGVETAEIIVSDGYSDDRTRDLVSDEIKVIISESNKAKQMNKAIAESKGNVIWFVHADMTLPQQALLYISECISSGSDGGGFANVFDRYNEKIKRIGNLLNLRLFDRREQSDRGIFYGDNGIFVKKELLLKIGGVPDQLIMEDYELSVRLKKSGAVMTKITSSVIVVSARRHIQNGFWKTRFQWIIIRELYKLGVNAKFLKKMYHDKRKSTVA